MRKSEFIKFFREFRAAFASVDAWIAKLPAKPPDDDFVGATQASLADAWYEILSDVTFDGARAAMKAMARGDLQSPIAFQEYPKEIRAYAKRGGKREGPPGPRLGPDGFDTFECPDCRDEGFVRIFTLEAMRAMQEKTWDTRHGNGTCLVRCHCRWGNHWRGWTKDDDGAEKIYYQTKFMVRCERPPTADDIERLKQFIESRLREPAF